MTITVEVSVVEQKEELFLVLANFHGRADANRRLQNGLAFFVGVGRINGRLEEVKLRPFDKLVSGGEVDPSVESVVEDLDAIDDEAVERSARRADTSDFTSESCFTVADKVREGRAFGEPNFDVVFDTVDFGGGEENEHIVFGLENGEATLFYGFEEKSSLLITKSFFTNENSFMIKEKKNVHLKKINFYCHSTTSCSSL